MPTQNKSVALEDEHNEGITLKSGVESSGRSLDVNSSEEEDCETMK